MGCLAGRQAALTSIMAAPVIRFLLGAVTDFALVPSLYLIAKRRRHFEMFVGITQVVTAVLFNTCAAFNVDLFLRESEWHFISDVLSLSYVCCLLVHALALPSEDVNIILRYVAFALAWVFKVRDSWDEGWWEGLLVGTYAVAAVARVAKEPFVLIHFQIRNLIAGGVLLVLVRKWGLWAISFFSVRGNALVFERSSPRMHSLPSCLFCMYRPWFAS